MGYFAKLRVDVFVSIKLFEHSQTAYESAVAMLACGNGQSCGHSSYGNGKVLPKMGKFIRMSKIPKFKAVRNTAEKYLEDFAAPFKKPTDWTLSLKNICQINSGSMWLSAPTGNIRTKFSVMFRHDRQNPNVYN